MSDPNNDYRDYWRRQNEPDGGQDPRNEQYWNGSDERGFRRLNDPNYGPIPEEYQSNSMSRAAFTCGVLAVISIFLSFVAVGGSFLFGALGLIFAFLSRKTKFNRQARTAIGMCLAGMISFAIMVGISFGVLIATDMWDVIIEKAGQVDPNDPTSVTVAEQEIMNELMDRFGLSIDSEAESGTDSDGTDSAGTGTFDTETDGKGSLVNTYAVTGTGAICQTDNLL